MAAPIGFSLDAVPVWFVEINTAGNSFKYQTIATNAQAAGLAKNSTTTYLAVCRGGLIYRTTNITLGIWTLVFTQPANLDFLDVAWGAGIFVVVGQGGIIYTSNDDGLTFVARTSGTANTLQRVIFGNGIFLTAGSNNTLRYSNAGATVWNASVITGIGTNNFNITDFVWTNSRWIAVGNNTAAVITQNRPSLQVGFILTSVDATTFALATSVPGLMSINSVAFNNANQVIAVADRGSYYTSDAIGTTWTGAAIGNDVSLNLIRFVNNQYIMINRNGVIYSGNNALTFTEVSKLNGFVYDIYFDTANFYFLNSNQIAISTLAGLSYFRVTTSPIDLTYQGNLFKSDQRLLGIGRVTQSLKNDGSQFSLQFAGQDYSLRDDFLSYNLQDRMLTVWVAVGNTNWTTGVLAVWFKGYINTVGWDVNVSQTLGGGSDSVFTIGCRDLVSRLKNTLAGRPANPNGMKRFFPADTSHDQLASERDRVITLGRGVSQ